uniref:COBRA-like protein n=1 Tax=Oryza nivara TaxID=4536 RepID=A0A0E0I3F6_ORYNI
MAVLGSLLLLILAATLSVAVAYDPLDPNGNITIKWDVMSWTPDGYVAMVTINNYQTYRQIMAPGWTVGWTWARQEVIWSMVGAQATDQGDCSRFKANLPHCCRRTPAVVDLLPGVPYNQQIANCCRGGVLPAYGQGPSAAAAAFQVSVGQAGTTNRTVRLPRNFTLLGPGPGYTCGRARVVPSTVFLTADRRRKTQALSKLTTPSSSSPAPPLMMSCLCAVTWNVTCTYSQHLASKYPSCCVSFSSFYNDTIVPCAKCACGCDAHKPCVRSERDGKRLAVTGKKHDANANAHGRGNGVAAAAMAAPLLQCTTHMCPVRVHWHVKLNYREYWRAKITIVNFNYRMNYTGWTLVAQHPNLDNITEVFSFDYKPVYFNDQLMEAGPHGNVQSEVLMRKDARTFTFRQGWAFPRKVYFNGDECQMPPPDSYPYLPNAAPPAAASLVGSAVAMAALVFFLMA